MKIRNVFILMAALVSGLYFSGCTEEDGTPTGNPPTAVQVTSLGGNPGGYSFGVRWTRASGDVGVNTIVATPASGAAAIEMTSNTSSGTITVPTAGKYTITVKGNDGSVSTGVEWATTTWSSTSALITLYETADNTPGHPSGLILGTPGEATSSAEAASVVGPKASQIDLVLATDNALPGLPFLALQGADVAGSGIPSGRATKVGDGAFQVAAGLAGDFYSGGIDGDFTSNFNSQPLPGTTSDPYIILVKTADAAPHYARVQIVPQSSGLLWKDVPGSGGTYRAIDVIVSYQPMSATPYVTRPGVLRGFNAPRNNAPIKSTVKN